MNKASWMSGFAGILGIIGIGMGFWWADALIAIIVSVDIMHDGFSNLKLSLYDLLDHAPKSINGDRIDPLISEIRSLIKKEPWVKSVKVRFRDEGHVFFGEIFITPTKSSSPEEVLKLQQKIQNYHWRFHDIVIMINPSLSGKVSTHS